MAEEPGVGTLSAAIEAMRQLFNFVQDAAIDSLLQLAPPADE